MIRFSEAPLPDETHYVGIIFTYEGMEDDLEYVLTIHNRDRYKGFTNTKLPGGKSDERFENVSDYLELLNFKLDKIGFEAETKEKILANENKRFEQLKQYDGKAKLITILRTMVIQALEELGYYAMDLEPFVIHTAEKPGHTQYFVWVQDFMDSKGKEVFIPNNRDGFEPLDPDVVETRVPIQVTETYKLIPSHRIAVEKYIEVRRRNTR